MVKIVYAFFYAISLLPFRLLYCIADFEYFMMYYVIKYRRGIVRKNLTTSFPEKSEEEIVDIEKKFYRWFSDYFFEAVKLLSIRDKELRQRFQRGFRPHVFVAIQHRQAVEVLHRHDGFRKSPPGRPGPRKNPAAPSASQKPPATMPKRRSRSSRTSPPSPARRPRPTR